VSALGFDERDVPLSLHGGTDPLAPLTIVLDVAGVQESVTVTASPGYVQESALAAQPVINVSPEEIFTRVRTVAAEAVAEETGVMLHAELPPWRAFIRGLTGNKVSVFVDGVLQTGSQGGTCFSSRGYEPEDRDPAGT
jgi:hypothetical protein